MEDFDSIAHLDFSIPADLGAGFESIQFESLEAKRIEIIQTLQGYVSHLDAQYGRLHPDDVDGYADRLFQLEALMRQDMENFGLSHGDLVQASVPNIVYPAGFMAEFDAGESVRARVEGLSIFPHYATAADGQSAALLSFGMNISVTEPMTVSPQGVTSIEGIGDMNPMISLHHDSADLHRVILPN